MLVGSKGNNTASTARPIKDRTVSIKKSDRPDPTSLAQITAQELADGYEANTIAADKNFKNKWFVVTGKVKDIRTDITDSAYVELSSKNMFNAPQAKFIASEEDKLANLQRGQTIKAMCVGNGDIIKTPMLKKCSLVE